MFNSLANASVLREFSGVKHRSVTMPLSWTEKSGKDIPSHVHDPATVSFQRLETAFSSCEKPRLLKKTSGAKHCLKQRLARAKN